MRAANPRQSAHSSGRHRRRPLLPRRQHRKGRLRYSGRRILDPAFTYARDLSSGRACRFRPSAGRTYPWRPDLLARIDPADAGFGAAAADGSGSLGIRQYGGIHFGRSWILHRAGPPELSAGHHAAPSEAGVIGRLLVREVAKPEPVKDTREEHRADKKRRHTYDYVDQR